MRTLLLLTAAFAAFAGEADWPQFRGPLSSGVGSSARPPVTFDGEKGTNVVWKAEVPGLAVSSPVVWGDRIFLTTAVSSDARQSLRTGLYGDTDPVNDSSPHQWKVLAYDRKTGKLLWEQTALQGVPKTKRHPKSSQASPTPATNGSVVVAYFGSEGLYAYSTAGKLLWKKDLGIQNAGWFFDPASEWGVASSPVIHKNTVIVQCDRQKDSFIAAFDLKDGREVWRTARAEIPAWGTPALVAVKDHVEVVTNATKAVRSYDADTGKELWWSTSLNSEITCTTPVSGHGLVFVANGYTPVRPIFAFKAGSTGDVTPKDGKDMSDGLAWSKKTGGSYLPSPLVYGNEFYTVNNNGVMAAYDAKTGSRLYEQRVGTGGSFTASPIAAAGKLYFSTEDGEIYVVKAGAQYEMLAKNNIGEPILATPAFAGDMLIVRGSKHLFAIQEAGR